MTVYHCRVRFVSSMGGVCCYPVSLLRNHPKILIWLLVVFCFPLLVLAVFLFLSCLLGIGALYFLRCALRLWNPRIEAVMGERTMKRFKEGLKRTAVQDEEERRLWDDGWLCWARAGVEGLKQLRVHEYLEDQLRNVGVLEEGPDGVVDLLSLGEIENRSVEEDSHSAKGTEVSREMPSSGFIDEDDDRAAVHKGMTTATFCYRNIDWMD